MKKLTKILVPFLLLNCTTLTGCGKKDGKVLLTFGDVHATESRVVDLEYLDNAIKAKENFILVVSTNTCGCWDEQFKPTLNSYLKKNKACCYRIDYNLIKNKDVASYYGLVMATSSTTTFAVYENGKLKTHLNTSTHKEIMNNTDKFAKFMSETVRLPKCFFIEKNDVEIIKNSGKNAVIYFERNGCGDCSAINPGILRNYVENHEEMNKIYVLDCQDYWKPSSDPDYDDYLEFKKELGLAEETNTKYGYGSGVFPFFSFIKKGAYASGSVIYNDKVVKEDGKYKISESYYTTERAKNLQYTNTVLKGKTIPKSDVDDNGVYCSWIKSKADSIYGDILDAFLDYALPKTTFKF